MNIYSPIDGRVCVSAFFFWSLLPMESSIDGRVLPSEDQFISLFSDGAEFRWIRLNTLPRGFDSINAAIATG